MSLQELKEAAVRLSPEEFTALTAFLVARDNAQWDEQIESDSAAGRLDFLFEEADRERAQGKLRDWPDA